MPVRRYRTQEVAGSSPASSIRFCSPSIEPERARVVRVVSEADVRTLHVLIANERRDRLELLANVVAGLGHDVIARAISVEEVGAVTAREGPDVALVGLGAHCDQALHL